MQMWCKKCAKVNPTSDAGYYAIAMTQLLKGAYLKLEGFPDRFIRTAKSHNTEPQKWVETKICPPGRVGEQFFMDPEIPIRPMFG